MAVAFDAVTKFLSGATTDPSSGTHTPVGTPAGAYVLLIHNGATPIVSGVTYGGVAMVEEIVDSDNSGAEQATAYLYTLEASIPTGAQTVSVDRTEATTPMVGVCWTVTANGAVAVESSASLVGVPNIADPFVTLDTNGKMCLALGGMYSGNPDSGNVVELGTMTNDAFHDFGANTAVASHQTTPSTADFDFGYTAAQSAFALVALTIAEVATAGQARRSTHQFRQRRV